MSDDSGHPCARFLSDLFDGVEGLVELRPLPDAEGADFSTASKGRRWLTPEEAIARGPAVSEWCQAHGLGAFFGVLPRLEPGNGKRANVHGGRVAWADLDFKDYDSGDPEARQRLSLLRLWPSILVSSGHGLHAYWLLHDVAESAEIEAANTLLIEAIGADPACKDAARVMRLPGSWNVKDPDHPREVKIIDHSGERYSLSEVMAAAAARIEEMKPTESPPVAPRPSGGADTRPAGETRTERYLAATLAGVLDDIAAAGKGTRNQQLNRGAYSLGRLVGAGVLTEAAAVAELTGAATGIGLGAHEAERTIRSGIEAGISKPWEPSTTPPQRSSAGPRKDGAGQRVVNTQPADVDPDLWQRLDLTRSGTARSSPRNLSIIIGSDASWKGRIWLNDHDGRIYLDEGLLTDAAEVGFRVWLSEAYGVDAGAQVTHDAMLWAATQNRRHPLREWLEELEQEGYDGQPRCEDLLSRYFGAEDNRLNREISRAFLVACCRRAFEPGVKVDNVLILVGPQGSLKSSAFRALAGRDQWFSDTGIDFRSKDAFQNLPGVWIYELAELDSMRRSDASAIKAFLSAQIDRYRPSYGRNVIEQPRQCVFVGTTNEAEFLADHTGSRRFWPVQVGTIDLEGIRRDLRQIWAEAMGWFRMGVPHWLSQDLSGQLSDQSEQYRQRDPWEGSIHEWIRMRHTTFRTEDVLLDAIKHEETHRHSRVDAMRVSNILKAAGCTKERRRVDGARAWWWRKPAVILDLHRPEEGEEDAL